MATLNTLRTKGGIIVIIVIGIALLAFLLGDLQGLSGSMNSKKSQVGEINGVKVSDMEYFRRVDYQTMIQKTMTGRDALSTQEQDDIKNVAWDEYISEYAIMPGLSKLGLMVSQTEQVDMVEGAYISPVVAGIFADEMGAYDVQRLRYFLKRKNEDVSGTTAAVWDYMQVQMNRERAMSKFMNLVSKGLFVTNLEVSDALASASKISDIEYVMKEYTSIADSTITVAASETKKYYNNHKKMFRQTASRDIEYVLFDVLPSEEDFVNVKAKIEVIANEFAQSATPLQFASINTQTRTPQIFLTADELSPGLAAFTFGGGSGEMYGPVLDVNTYTLARVVEKQMRPDSLGAKHILLNPAQTAQADSLVNALKGGADFAMLSLKYSSDQYANSQGGDLGTFATEQMIPEFSNALIKANTGDIFAVTTPAGLHVVQLTHKGTLVQKAKLAEIIYHVEPSQITQDVVYDQASKFVAVAAQGYDAFNSAVAENSLSKRVARIRSSEREINGMTQSREVVRWAFNSKSGEVSGIIDIDGDYLIAAVASATEDGFAPYESVAANIEAMLKHEKKGDMLVEQMSGGSFSEVATKVGADVLQANGVDFNKYVVENLSVEPQLIGAVSVAQPNTVSVSRPVKGMAGVFVFNVTNAQQSTEPVMPDFEKVKINATNQSYIMERINAAMMEESGIKDNRVRF